MADSIKTIVFRERAWNVLGLGLIVVLATFLASISFYWLPAYVTEGRLVDATVIRVGTYAAGGVSGGDLPILTVRLPDGSIRQVKASWSIAGDCLPGSHVGLRQRGSALQVGLRGCRKWTPSS